MVLITTAPPLVAVEVGMDTGTAAGSERFQERLPVNIRAQAINGLGAVSRILLAGAPCNNSMMQDKQS